jgi:hypothetical protein
MAGARVGTFALDVLFFLAWTLFGISCLALIAGKPAQLLVQHLLDTGVRSVGSPDSAAVPTVRPRVCAPTSL